MSKIEKILIDSIKKMNGYVLGFGNLDEKTIKEIDKNKNISEFMLLSDNCINTGGKQKAKRKKHILYKKIRKKFKKKNVTNVIACYDDLKKYRRRFISDSLFLSKENIYVFIKDEDIDEELVERRFKRYHQEVKLIECSDGFVLHIKKIKYRKNKFRDTLYLFLDSISDMVSLIGDLFII